MKVHCIREFKESTPRYKIDEKGSMNIANDRSLFS